MEFVYPENCTGVEARKKHRNRIRREKSNTLYVDTCQQNGVKKRIDLSFYSPLITAWKSTFCFEYKHVVKNAINNGEQLIICNDQMLDKEHPILTISCYNTGTFIVQAFEASLDSFESIFPKLKARVERERDQTHVNSTETPPPSTSDHQLTEEQQGPTEKRAQPQTAAEETNLSIPKLTTDFSKLNSK